MNARECPRILTHEVLRLGQPGSGRAQAVRIRETLSSRRGRDLTGIKAAPTNAQIKDVVKVSKEALAALAGETPYRPNNKIPAASRVPRPPMETGKALIATTAGNVQSICDKGNGFGETAAKFSARTAESATCERRPQLIPRSRTLG